MHRAAPPRDHQPIHCAQADALPAAERLLRCRAAPLPDSRRDVSILTPPPLPLTDRERLALFKVIQCLLWPLQLAIVQHTPPGVNPVFTLLSFATSCVEWIVITDLALASGCGSSDFIVKSKQHGDVHVKACLLYTSPSPRDQRGSRMPSSA